MHSRPRIKQTPVHYSEQVSELCFVDQSFTLDKRSRLSKSKFCFKIFLRMTKNYCTLIRTVQFHNVLKGNNDLKLRGR